MRHKQKTRRKGMSKSKSQDIHAKKRAAERYSVILEKDDLKTLIKQIQNNSGGFGSGGTFVSKQSLTRAFHIVRHFDESYMNGIDMLAIYDSSRKTIRTFLDPSLIKDLIEATEKEE